MSEGKGKAVNPAPLEDRMDRVERMLERVVEVMLIRESLQGGSHHKKPRIEPVKSGNSSGTSNRPAKCPKCKKYHRGVCFRASGACFKCGQQGHLIRNCPKGSIASKVLPNIEEDGLYDEIQLAKTLHKLSMQEEIVDRALVTEPSLGKLKRKADFEGEELQAGNPSKKQEMESTRMGSSNEKSNNSRECPSCRKRHKGICFRATGACFKCGQQGHLMRNCSKESTVSNTLPASTGMQ